METTQYDPVGLTPILVEAGFVIRKPCHPIKAGGDNQSQSPSLLGSGGGKLQK